MKAPKKTLNLALKAIIAAATLSLVGCSTTSSQIAANPFAALSNEYTLADYQKAYDGASTEDSFNNLIVLSRASIVAGDSVNARNYVNELNAKAQSFEQKEEAKIISALYLSSVGQLEKSVKLLDTVNYQALPVSSATYYLNLASRENSKLATKKQDPVHQVAAYQYKAALLNYATDSEDKNTILNECIALLSRLNDKTLASKLSSASNEIDRGFYEYAIASKSLDQNIKDEALRSFTQNHPNHPLNALLAPESVVDTTEAHEFLGKDEEVSFNKTPTNINKNAIFSFKDGDKIAVLLPLSGRLAAFGEPARLGVLAALKDRGSSSQVTFYDTNKQNISEIVATISTNGTKLIIGPILKPELQALNSTTHNIPSIVLNTPEGNKPVNQWYFDLGPNYEGALAAAKIYQDGYKNTLIIQAANDQNAERSATAFRQSFSKVNAQSQACKYQDVNSIKSTVVNCLNTNFDSAYINASAADAVNIKAALPTRLPAYLTDKSYLGVNNTAQEVALSGAKLGDMPWVLTDSKLKNAFMQSLPKANSQIQRIFAAGYDAVNFAYSIEKLSEDSNDVLHGLTGDISLTDTGLIETSPMWLELGSFR